MSEGKVKVGILISGRGSNMESIVRKAKADEIPAEVVVVISNKPEAPGIRKAEAFGIPVAVIDHKKFSSREDFERALVSELKSRGVELVCLAGFMRILSPTFIREFPGRIMNIHPSLLPAFPGLNVHNRVLESGAKFSGCTVHFVTEDVDAGPIIIQAVVPVLDDDTEETLAARVLVEEHKIYPEAIRLFAEGRLEVRGKRVIWKK
ncbi:MAG: phosphoribosylglycinamide formyltransferase [Acidobacteria bacterium]|nr:phosphoribosylglycinamide formyltransferase [Acidobacteriota bacterium]